MCMVDDGGYVDFSSERWRVARKEHECDECWRTIAVGERYRYCFLKYDGDVSYHHTCSHCTAAEDWLREHCNGWMYGAVIDDLADHCEYGQWSADEARQPIKISRPARLVVAMRRKWRRFDGAGLMEI